MSQVYLNCRFLTQRITGVQRFAVEICRQLDCLINDYPQLELIGLLPRQAILAQYGQQTFKHIKLYQVGNLTGHLWEQLELPYFSRGKLLINLCNAAPLIKRQQIITIHDIIFTTNYDSQKWWFRSWYYLMSKINLHQARVVFTVSEFSRQAIAKWSKRNLADIIVLGNAPSLANYKYADEILTQLNLTSGNYFLLIGSNSRRKNTQMVAKLFASSDKLVNFNLVIVGGQYSNLKHVTPIIAPNIIYTDYITDCQLRSLYRSSRGLIFPSLYEGFGIPLLEAMAEQTPVLVSDIPICHEVCATAALYFNPKQSQELEQQLLNLLNQPDLANQLVANANLRLANYHWQSYAKLILEQLIQFS
ncbi:MAG: hypothetical protein RLZZ293_547 [Pseudomonadota bacterium]|jgi:glycosyltransferase involved in cell wall biosynthesis